MIERLTQETIDRALAAYKEAALWSSVGEDGEPLDASYSVEDIDTATAEQMREDVESFLSACWGDTWEDFSIDLSGIEPEQIGHDLWLTRNGHGAGFWDRGLGEVGEALTKLAKSFGGVDLLENGDGTVGDGSAVSEPCCYGFTTSGGTDHEHGCPNR